ncbi:MAG: hypothetical protein Q9163_004316 [Psora crenata]
MSLQVEGHSRGRSKSPGRRDERSRSREVRAPSPSIQVVIKSGKRSDESDADSKPRKKHSKKHYSSLESDRDQRYERERASKKRYDSSSSDSDSKAQKHSSRKRHSDSDSDSKPHRRKPSKQYSYDDENDSDSKPHRRKSSKQYSYDNGSDSGSGSGSDQDDRRRVHQKERLTQYHRRSESSEHHDKHGHHERHEHHSGHSRQKEYYHDDKGEKVIIRPGEYASSQEYVLARPASNRDSGRGPQYAKLGKYQYASSDRKISYTAQPQFVESKPHRRTSSPPSMHRLSVSSGNPGAMALAAPGSHHGSTSGGLPPGSPLLEAYRGTYQSISPLPSPLILASRDDSDLSDLSALDDSDVSDNSRGPRSRSKKKVSFYDPEHDALALAAALKHSTPDSKPIIKILPHLSDDEILMLRTEYKKHMKAQGKGVNIAKHIKMKVPGNLGKVAYAVALGRWESEAHWANFWYQSSSSRRELLIESLMGRSNSEILKIKEAFCDQRYNNSLEKCMEMELKKDKFRHAILLALEGRRMSESEKLDLNHVRRDAEHLYNALTAREGGETAMINIVVVRSNKHLAEMLRVFEAMYKRNFVRQMIQRSQNLVGETLAHILNGVLNRPVRDALLLHQALKETSRDRTELLISRLVRFHWEPRHLERVKLAYKQKYRRRLEEDALDRTKGDFGEFVRQLCRVED